MKRLVVTVFAIGMSACALDPTGVPQDQQAPDEDLVAPSPEYLASAKGQAAAAFDAEPRHAPCGTVGPNLQNQVIADVAINGAANQRSGSSTGCVILGVLQPTDDARYHCWTLGNDGFTWTYARSIRTGVAGWTRDNLLRSFGSNRRCPPPID